MQTRDTMRTEIHRMGFFTHQIYTRTPRRLSSQSVTIRTAQRGPVKHFQRGIKHTPEMDVEALSTPTHRCAVLILEAK